MWPLLALQISTVSVLTTASTAPLVTCPWGSVQGVVMEGQGGRQVNAFLGIPYALPPTGQRRWQKPHPHPGPDDGQVFTADKFTAACPQEYPGMGITVAMDEDCLTLNIFTPISVTAPKAVMVWIHGGGLTIGEAPPYRPFKLVADGDVIVVTIQYRLAALGFLSTGDDTLPGNLGLWDQNLALRWVKNNIRAFGGDPDMVTLFGESAGGWSTGLQLVSPYSKGLFQRAILQSGSPQTAVSFLPVPQRAAFKGIAGKLGCDHEDNVSALDCLKTKAAEELIRAADEWAKENKLTVAVCARVDGDFIPRDPLELVQDEAFVESNGIGDVDIIAGVTNNEGAVLLVNTVRTGTTFESLSNPQLFNFLLHLMVQTHTGRSDRVLQSVAEFFYRNADFGTSNPVPLGTVLDMYGDVTFYAPAIQFLRPLVALPHKGARYLYLFDQDLQFNAQNGVPGSHHVDELFLEFDFQLPKESIWAPFNKSWQYCSEEEHRLGDLFLSSLTTFAKTGNPNPAAVKTALGGEWPQFTAEDEVYMAFSTSPSVGRDVFKDRVAFWSQLVPEIVSTLQRQQERKNSGTSGKDEL